jgi:hypothetical protein
MKPLTRKQAREALQTVPIDQVLSVSGELTHKQREFARLVALGETGSGAYRKAYKSKGKPQTAAGMAHRLKSQPEINRTIEAFKLANEAAAYQTPAQLRALVLHSLVQVITDPDAKHATKVQAAKVLGTVTEVAAFTERKEIRTVKTSEDAKTAVLAKLREVLRGSSEDATIIDADSLMRDIVGTDDIHSPADPAPDASAPAADPVPPTPPNAVWSPSSPMHSNPHEQFHSKSDDPPPPSEISTLEAELSGETPPLGVSVESDGGDISGKSSTGN